MVNVLKMFLQNIKIYHHEVLTVCKYLFLQDLILPRHQLTFKKTQALTRSLVIHGWICNTEISVEQDWNGKSWQQTKQQLQEESKART